MYSRMPIADSLRTTCNQFYKRLNVLRKSLIQTVYETKMSLAWQV